jgi:L,D-transpeptidase YbiS
MRLRTWLFMLIPVVVLAGGAAVAWRLLYPPVPIPEAALTEVSAIKLAQLPADAGQAKKTLAQLRKALEKLAPPGPYIVINTHANIVSYRTDKDVILQGVCSSGSGGALVDSLTGQKWIFNTPRGVFKINSKLKDPMWRKPDWAFIEEGDRPPKDPNERYDDKVLGDYAMGFGKGYFIHGTLYESLLGISITHGCVRLGSEDLRKFYDRVKIGTPVYIF